MITSFDVIQIEDFGKLYVSSDREDWTIVTEQKISLLIDMDGDLDKGIPTTPDKIIYIYYPILDEDLPDLTKLHATARFAADLCRHRFDVLAHCQLGLNRSALLIGVILTYLGLTGEAALNLLRSRRPGALFNDVFAEYLKSLPANNTENS